MQKCEIRKFKSMKFNKEKIQKKMEPYLHF